MMDHRGMLTVEAINPVLLSGWRSLIWMIRGAKWELTCGFCRTHFQSYAPMVASYIDCPSCGTRNRLSSAGWPWRPMGRRRG
jgi:hypothetical protein